MVSGAESELVTVGKEPRERMAFSPESRGALVALVREGESGGLDEVRSPGYDAVMELNVLPIGWGQEKESNWLEEIEGLWDQIGRAFSGPALLLGVMKLYMELRGVRAGDSRNMSSTGTPGFK